MARTKVLLLFVALLCLAPQLLPNTEALCEQRSTSWSGFCGDTSHCDGQCREQEHADHGACHADGLGSACFCYFPTCLCKRYSQTWSGFCGDSGHCDNQCRNWEHATHGACKADGNGSACFCYSPC